MKKILLKIPTVFREKALTFFLCVLLSGGAVFGQQYTVMTYNIRYDNPGDGDNQWSNRKTDLVEEVKKWHPTIIGFQEVLPEQRSFLQMEFPQYKSYGLGREDGAEKGEQVPVFYDTTVFRLLSCKTYWLAENIYKPSKGWDAACERVAAIVLLQDVERGDSVWVVNTHWDHIGKEARKNSPEVIHRLIAPMLDAKQKVILMGDFNATPDDECTRYVMQFLRDSCPKEKRKSGTFNNFELKPAVSPHIDYILLSHMNWKLKSYRILHPKTSNGLQMSDHYPVVVTVRVRR